MRYMGSKARIAKDILPIMLAERGDRVWVEPFVGGGNIIQFIKGRRLGSDINKWVIACLEAASKGWLPKETYSEQEYIQAKLKYQTDLEEDKHEIGYLGFACSFGGMFFGSFARSKDSKGNARDMAAEQYRYCVKQFKLLEGCEFVNTSYFDLEIPEKSIIYCDPPYKGTIEYKVEAFNYERFYEWCIHKVEEGHIVYVSEYAIDHPRFILVWEKEVKSGIRRLNNEAKTERLFKVV